MSHKCSGCANFQKMKTMVGNSGLCLAQDRRTDEDRGNGCALWQAVPYDRAKEKRSAQRELQTV